MPIFGKGAVHGALGGVGDDRERLLPLPVQHYAVTLQNNVIGYIMARRTCSRPRAQMPVAPHQAAIMESYSAESSNGWSWQEAIKEYAIN